MAESTHSEQHADDDAAERPELSHLASWSVSSHKYGFGVDNLRDGNDNTFWQSEGPQPHLIDLSFPKRVHISAIAVHMSHARDDSYTPSRLSIRAGTGVHDLQEVRHMEFSKPDGWIPIVLRPMEVTEHGEETEGPPIPCHHLRIIILANHLNGKDTHVRGLRVFGAPTQPQNPSTTPLSPLSDTSSTQGSGLKRTTGKQLLELGHDGLSGFTSTQFKMHEFIR
uniref:Anaphase-promoting complex subunit 10 n=1 Tax=Kwoniella dejecticola CBS 10117 TaxID=1296121 RepID=A0A1A5ZU25_9TREE|nr:anaphase-promoting complex subunit 10 [Kwoniella dejecticola CBS 10117]OBR81314.1 anaphase-promoting complex subunit 10 [Kwoniella dejecticola CBS 10117]